MGKPVRAEFTGDPCLDPGIVYLSQAEGTECKQVAETLKCTAKWIEDTADEMFSGYIERIETPPAEEFLTFASKYARVAEECGAERPELYTLLVMERTREAVEQALRRRAVEETLKMLEEAAECAEEEEED